MNFTKQEAAIILGMFVGVAERIGNDSTSIISEEEFNTVGEIMLEMTEREGTEVIEKVVAGALRTIRQDGDIPE